MYNLYSGAKVGIALMHGKVVSLTVLDDLSTAMSKEMRNRLYLWAIYTIDSIKWKT